MKDECGTGRYGDSSLHHDLVDDLRVGLHLELTFLIDADEAGEESLARYPEMIKLQISIVNVIVAKFRADFAHLNARERLMCPEVTHWHDIGLHTVVRLICDASCKNDGMCGLDSKIAWPELGGSDRGCVNHELISLHIQRRRSLQPSHV